MTMQELSDEMRKERARCSTHCGTWNREDRDCEIYGEQHCPPSKCRYFLAQEVARRNEEWYVILNMNCQYEICRKCPKSGLFKGTYEECEKWIEQKEKKEND